MRTLLHDTGSSVSLLSQLGIKSALRFYDRYAEGQGEKARIFVGVGMQFAENGLKYVATFTEPTSTSEFQTYWNGIAIKEAGYTHRRRDVILGVANQDGGAHIDPSLMETYARLSRDFASPWTVTVGGKPGTVLHGPQLPIVRQCAFEVELTIARQASKLLGGEAW